MANLHLITEFTKIFSCQCFVLQKCGSLCVMILSQYKANHIFIASYLLESYTSTYVAMQLL